jgi:hypothetical protein
MPVPLQFPPLEVLNVPQETVMFLVRGCPEANKLAIKSNTYETHLAVCDHLSTVCSTSHQPGSATSTDCMVLTDPSAISICKGSNVSRGSLSCI